MENLKVSDLPITQEALRIDDNTLVEMYTQLYNDTLERKEKFNYTLLNCNENDYLSLTVARLAYVFAKEKCETIQEEIRKRGLITQQKATTIYSGNA